MRSGSYRCQKVAAYVTLTSPSIRARRDPKVIMLFSSLRYSLFTFFFFLKDTPPTEFSPLSLPDPLPISLLEQPVHRRTDDRLPHATTLAVGSHGERAHPAFGPGAVRDVERDDMPRLVAPQHRAGAGRSEEHTSELQSQSNLVCRLLLEKK